MLKQGALLTRAPRAIIFTRLTSEHTTLDNLRRAGLPGLCSCVARTFNVPKRML